jgi:hypothetical protein
MRRTTLFALIAVLALFTSASATFAQATASGTIEGTVLDKSQSSISEAEVTITSKATGTTRSATSSDVGTFRFDLLSAGFYTVKVSTVVQTVELLVGQTSTANVTLNPGAVSETLKSPNRLPCSMSPRPASARTLRRRKSKNSQWSAATSRTWPTSRLV